MTDTEIFKMLQQKINLSENDIKDYRPCNKLYTAEFGIPTISDAITITIKQGGILIYIPDKDSDGGKINRPQKYKTLYETNTSTDSV